MPIDVEQRDSPQRAVAIFLAEGDAEAEDLLRETDRLLAAGETVPIPGTFSGSAGVTGAVLPTADWPPVAAGAVGGDNVRPSFRAACAERHRARRRD